MGGSMLATSWYRVAELKPRLRSHARLHRHRYRGQLWYLLQDPVSNRVHRFSPAARLFIAAMDGRRSVQRLWELINKHLGENAPTQDEIIQLLGQLHAADLLQSDVTPDTAEIFDRGERQEKLQRRRSYMNPMSVRIHLWDPDAFLNRFATLVRLLWSRWGGLLWLAVVLPALILIPSHWPELSNNFSDRVLAVDNLLLLWLVFPLTKFMHEMGHAAATKRGGGEVHDMGIVMLVLIPIPYVEASSASVFRSKYERALVGAAGMMVEVFLAALAFYSWLLVEPGMVRAGLFNVMLVAGVSTLIFNGNPLLRYDAYYMLADLLEMPNLGSRSLRYLGYLVERYAFGVEEAEDSHGSASEKVWFLIYGVASTIYRMMVTFAIALFIAGKFFIIGIILALWSLGAMVLYPIVRMLQHVGSSPRLRLQRQRAIAVTASAVLVLGMLLFKLPLPYRTTAEGVIWLPEQAMVRMGYEGLVDRLLVTPGTLVKKGEPLVRSHDLTLEAQIRHAEAKVEELEADYHAQFVTDRAGAGIVREQLESEKANLGVLRAHAEGLLARAGSDGIFMSPMAADLPGSFFKKGELLGYVLDKMRPVARVVVPQEEIDLVRQATRVRVRFVHRPDLVTTGRIVREVPAGGEYLPSRALATEGGGHIVIDPRDQKDAKALERFFQLDVELTGADVRPYPFFGERVYVRFDHGKAPLGLQWYRAIRLLFLSHFHV